MHLNRSLIILTLASYLFLGLQPKSTNHADALTAGEVVSRIKKHLTTPWLDETVDTFKGGGPDMEVGGIATTFLATMEVLRKAHEAGLNMVITHEPTFYNHLDNTEQLDGDAVLKAKQEYIAANNMIVFRFHDHIHRTDPDGIYLGVVEQLGWTGYQASQRPYLYTLPPSNLKSLSKKLQATFPTANIRVVGDPQMAVSMAGLVLGAAGSERQIEYLQRDDVEVLIIGETREWETVEYVRDAVEQGKKKALIMLGHAISEEGGMQNCAGWLQSFIPEVPVKFIPAGDPFWTPN
jgi:putative NIF3 family GTP cyclohydrolase 1 type 2